MEREPEQLFLDDFSAGQTYPGQPRTITKDDILSFAALTATRIRSTTTMNTPNRRDLAGRSFTAFTSWR